MPGPTRWEVSTKDGRISDYGVLQWLVSDGWGQSNNGANDRVNTVKSWMLDRVSDRLGNRMEYQ
jgi:hypothetical protein